MSQSDRTIPLIFLDLGGLDELGPGAGLFRYAIDLILALHALSPPARFAVLGSYPQPITELKDVFRPGQNRWQYRFFPRPAGFASEYRNQVRIAWKLIRAGAHLYHCLQTFVPVLAPCPLVVTVHDLMYELFPGYEAALRSRPFRIFRWGLRHRVRRVICPSQTTASDLRRLWGLYSSRLDVIYHGLRVFGPQRADGGGEFTNRPLRSLNAFPFIAAPLHLEPRKNLITLLEAFAMLAPGFSQFRLVLFGKSGWSDERERQFMNDLNRLGLLGRVVLPGLLTDDDLWLVYRRAALFVLPSLYEGFGYPILEAMSAGTCPVVRGASSMAEVVEEAGVMIEPFTAVALCATMAELLGNDKLRSELGKAAQRRAMEFSSERMARNTFAVYRKALGFREVSQIGSLPVLTVPPR